MVCCGRGKPECKCHEYQYKKERSYQAATKNIDNPLRDLHGIPCRDMLYGLYLPCCWLFSDIGASQFEGFRRLNNLDCWRFGNWLIWWIVFSHFIPSM